MSPTGHKALFPMMRPKKSLGQHFLTDQQIVNRILESLPASNNDRVIEVGPGTGALTRGLQSRFNDLHVFEVDERAVRLIQQTLPGVVVHAQSILEADFETLGKGTDGNLVIVGNLPYFLTSPILFRVMDQGMLFSQALFMIQKEVAQRLVACPRTKDYGILSVQAQVLGSPELLFGVSRHAFNPPPNVESAVISYRPGNVLYPGSIQDLPVSLEMFKKVVRTAFQQRRKKLSNALKPLFGSHFPEGFDAGRRAEELKPCEFVKLAEWLAGKK